MILFLYGTLLDPRVLARWSGEAGLARRLRPARLAGLAQVVLRGMPYPTLIPRAGAETEGALLRASSAARARLARYEGPSYRLLLGLVLRPTSAYSGVRSELNANPL